MTITIKNVPRAVHQALKKQAKDNRRSLNQELNKRLEEVADAAARRQAFAKAMQLRDKLAGKGVRIPARLAPEKIIRQLRDSR